MWWTCPKGHDYRARIDKVTLGLKCPVCNSRRLTPGENDLATVEATTDSGGDASPTNTNTPKPCKTAANPKAAQCAHQPIASWHGNTWQSGAAHPPQPQHTGDEIVEPTPGNCSAVSVPAPAIRLDEASVAEE